VAADSARIACIHRGGPGKQDTRLGWRKDLLSALVWFCASIFRPHWTWVLLCGHCGRSIFHREEKQRCELYGGTAYRRLRLKTAHAAGGSKTALRHLALPQKGRGGMGAWRTGHKKHMAMETGIKGQDSEKQPAEPAT